MSFDTLTDFLNELEDEGELVRVAAEVDAELELAAIVERICKTNGPNPAILFNNVRGYTVPVVANLLGSEGRLSKSLGVRSLEELSQRIQQLVEFPPPTGIADVVKALPAFAPLTQMAPKVVSTAECQQVVKVGSDIKLSELPVPRCWPEEGRPQITMGQVVTQNLETHIRDVSLTPVQLLGDQQVAICWNEQDIGWRNYCAYESRSQLMPVAIVLGGDPVLSQVASLPFAASTDDYVVAGFLRGKNVPLIRCRTIDLEVPAGAEIVIEGQITTGNELVETTPIALDAGCYLPSDNAPLMQVSAVTHRSNPVFPAIVPGPPPSERYWMRKAGERLFFPFLKMFLPEVSDYAMPQAGAAQHLLFVSIDKQYPHHARKVMHAIWGLDWLCTFKMVVVVDRDVSVDVDSQVWRAVAANVHPVRDVTFAEGPANRGDRATPQVGLGSKVGIDATRKLAGEGHPREWSHDLQSSNQVMELVARRWSEYGFADLSKREDQT